MTEPQTVQIIPGSPPRFRDMAQIIAPSWLQRYWGQRFQYALGLQWDAFSQAASDGVRARAPGAPGTPLDALSYIGADRQLIRGLNETDEGFAARCSGAFSAWARAGSAEGTIREIQALVSPMATSAAQVNYGQSGYRTWALVSAPGLPCVYVFGNPAAWNWDNDDSAWSRCWLILRIDSATWPAPKIGATGRKIGAASWVIGIETQAANIQAIRTVVGRWKSAATLAQVILSYDPSWPVATAAPMPNSTWARSP
jgi:hypothetical protein